MKDVVQEELRKIPSVDKILSRKEINLYLKKFSRKFVKVYCNKLLRETREEIFL